MTNLCQAFTGRERASKRQTEREREMAEPRWKRAAGAHVAPARGDCVRAIQRLGHALQNLRSPQLLHHRDAAGRYVRLDAAADLVERAAWSLSTSMGHMAAAEFLALRGCGAVPTDPVASVADLHHGADAHHGVWLTLARLQGARQYGQDALRATEEAFGHLWAARFMGAFLPAAAGPHAVMEDQVRDAVGKIEGIVGIILNMDAMALFANQTTGLIQDV